MTKLQMYSKHLIYKAIIESVSKYETEVWVLNQKQKEKLNAMEMDFGIRISRPYL